MEAARVQAAKLGLDVTKLDQSFAEGAAELNRQRSQATRGVYEQIAAARGDNSLATQLHMLETEMRDLAKAALDLGIPIEMVTEAHIAAGRRLREEYAANIRAMERQEVDLNRQLAGSVRGLDSFFTGLIDPLRAANDAGLSPLGQIASKRREFQDLARLARGGDLEATQALAGSAQELQGLSSRFLGSGGMGSEIQREIQAATGGVIANLEQQRLEAMASVPQVIRETVAEQIRTQVDGVNRVVEAVTELRRELALQRRAA